MSESDPPDGRAFAAPTVRWTRELRALCYLRRRPGTTPPKLDAVTAWAAVSSHYRTIAAVWARSESHAEPAIATLLEAACAYLSGATPHVDSSEVAGAAFIVMQHALDKKVESPIDDLVTCWVASAGPAFAAEALVASRRFELHGLRKPKVPPLLQLAREIPVPFTVPYHDYMAATVYPDNATLERDRALGWLWLQEYLAACDQPSWEAARDRAAALRGNATPWTRTGLAFLFPEIPEWAEADVRERLASGPGNSKLGMLLTRVRDPELLAQMAGLTSTNAFLLRRPGYSYDTSKDRAACLLSIIDGVGTDAVAPLLVWIDRAAARRDHERLRDYAAALAIIDSDQAIEAMVDRLDLARAPRPRSVYDEPPTWAGFILQALKTIAMYLTGQPGRKLDRDANKWGKRRYLNATLRIFVKALRASPRRALLALAGRAGSGRAEIDALLAVIAKEQPALCDELAPSLPDRARQILANVRGR